MKKVFLAALAALVSLSLGAQSFSITEENYSGTEELQEDTGMWHSDSAFGWGYHMMLDGDADFLDNTTTFGKNREIFFTLLGVEFRPVKFAGLSVAADLNWDAYRLNKKHYWQPADGAVSVASLDDATCKYQEIKKSVLRSFGFDFPVQLKLHFGDLCIAGGIVGELNFPGRTKFKAVTNDGGSFKNGDMRVKDIKSVPFTYSYRASITYSHLGLYGKYSPCSQFAPGYGPQFSYWTVGLILW
jgi:hypothetical protein